MGRKKSILAIGVLVTAASLYFALRGTDFAEIGLSLRRARIELIPVFLACLAGFYALKAFRWRRLLQGDCAAPPAKTLAGPMMIGFAANNLLPFRLGEIIRMVVGAKRTSLPQVTILTSIVVERIFDVMAVLTLASVVMWTDVGPIMTHPIIPYLFVATVAVAFGLFLLAFGSATIFRLLNSLATHNPSRIAGWLLGKAHTVDAGLQSIRSPKHLSAIILNSIVQWLLLAITIFLACWSVGVVITVSTAIYLMLVMTIAISIPSTPGFIGVIEYSFVLTLGAFGIDAERALAAAIFYHVITWLFATVIGTVFLHRYSLGWTQLGRSQAVEDLATPRDA